MSSMSRRGFMSIVGTAGLTIGPLTALQARVARGAPAFGRGFGPLSPKLPLNSSQLINPFMGDLRGQNILALPEGFEYWVISSTGDTMPDGTLVPGDHDGMAAFRGPNATTILVRNHELSASGGDLAKPAVIGPADMMYDPTCRGGTTTLVLDNQGRLIHQYHSVAGTNNNCAGGLTPWNTWVTCEENTNNAGQGGVTRPHGYNFEVQALSGELTRAEPLVNMGRFNHEAIAIDPRTGFVYQTEDRGDSCFYRFSPGQYGNLQSEGPLEALKLRDLPGANTGAGFGGYLNQPLAVEWVPITEVNPASDGAPGGVRFQGHALGAARFVRGEGAWYGNGNIYFVATGGGDSGAGQVFAYDPAAETLTLVVQAVPASQIGYTDPSHMGSDPVLGNDSGFVFAAPDNVTVGPDGRLYLCEDGSGVEKVVGVNHDGELFEVARNLLNGNELAGSCFSHDGRFMFVNIQGPGLTCVVRGNWRQGQG